MINNIKCSWTQCQHCINVKDIEGQCSHTNGTEYNIENNKTIVKNNTMIRCELYSSENNV